MSAPSLPASLAARPRDTRRDLPIPVVNEFPEGPDFTVVNGLVAFDLAKQRCCGLCGQYIPAIVAFLGGPTSAEAGTYSDPPMHPGCARAALRLCPHIAIERARRASENHTREGAGVPEGWVEAKPPAWVLVLATEFTIQMQSDGAGGGYPIYLPEQQGMRTETFAYDTSGTLVEVAR